MRNGATVRFRDRVDAGEQLAERVSAWFGSNHPEVLVLALPRGGVPVAFEISRRLVAPMDVFVARKIGAPGHPEAGIGAIAEGADAIVVDERAVRALRIKSDHLDELITEERHELARRVERYRQGRPLPDIAGRDVVLVDDGLATGVTAEVSLRALRTRKPASLLLAVPVCAPDAGRRLRGVADDVVCVLDPKHFYAVGQWYDRFDQTRDDEVLALLEAARVHTRIP